MQQGAGTQDGVFVRVYANKELEATINAAEADVVVEGTPIDLRRVLKSNKPIANVIQRM